MITYIPYEFGALLAVLAYVYSVVLTEPEMLLNCFYRKLYYIFKTDKREQAGEGKHWLFKIIIACEKCVAGQWAFWCFLFYNAAQYSEYAFYEWGLFVNLFFSHLFFIAYVITATIVIKKYTNEQ